MKKPHKRSKASSPTKRGPRQHRDELGDDELEAVTGGAKASDSGSGKKRTVVKILPLKSTKAMVN
jgi:hypothetical protein